jgi:hypothetical protein
MSERPRTPLQANINRDGGLYDQALEEDGLRYIANKSEQDTAYASYIYNIEATQKREQNDAYATYEDNIQVTQDREKAELEDLRKRLKKEKIKRGIGKVAAMALMIPGVDVIAEIIDEEVTSAKLNKKRRNLYKERNGTLFGNKEKGYASTLGMKYKNNTRRFTKKSEPIIQDLQTLIAEHEQRMQ